MPRVLLAEDEPTTALLLEQWLRHDGYDVMVAPDGRAALRLDEADTADLVVTDINMPEMNGVELLRRIRQRRPGVPAIIVSASCDLAAEMLRKDSSRTTIFIKKPVSSASLHDAVFNLMHRAA
jgi:CheY-like chemotaxis protein